MSNLLSETLIRAAKTKNVGLLRTALRIPVTYRMSVNAVAFQCLAAENALTVDQQKWIAENSDRINAKSLDKAGVKRALKQLEQIGAVNEGETAKDAFIRLAPRDYQELVREQIKEI